MAAAFSFARRRTVSARLSSDAQVSRFGNSGVELFVCLLACCVLAWLHVCLFVFLLVGWFVRSLVRSLVGSLAGLFVRLIEGFLFSF